MNPNRGRAHQGVSGAGFNVECVLGVNALERWQDGELYFEQADEKCSDCTYGVASNRLCTKTATSRKL